MQQHGGGGTRDYLFEEVGNLLQKRAEVHASGHRLEKPCLCLHQDLCPLSRRNIPGRSYDADDFSRLVLERNARHHQPTVAFETELLDAKVRFTAVHHAAFDGGNLFGRPGGMEVEVGETDELLHALQSIVRDNRLVGEQEATFEILRVDVVRHMVDHGLQPIITLGRAWPM